MLHAGTSAASGGAATTGAAAAGTGAAATAGGATAKLGAALVVKWVGIGLLAGTVTSVGANAVTSPPTRSTLANDSALDAPAKPAALPTAATPKAAFAATAEPELAAAATAPAPSAAPAEEAPANDVAAEVALLDRARKAVSQGDSAAALAALEKHQSEFKNGSLGPEADVLRIEALVARGDSSAAAQAARAFLAAHGSSPHVARVRTLLKKTAGAARPVPQLAAAPAAPEPEEPAPSPAPTAPATASFPVP
jgi:TolA-binding protein